MIIGINFIQINIHMKKDEKIKIIEESIKLYSWGTKQHSSLQFSQTGRQPPVIKDVSNVGRVQQHQSSKSSQFQLDNLQAGFIKLKNDQIQKLKDLRNEYDEIKKITTDYAIPNGSEVSSVISSSVQNSIKSPFIGPGSPKQHNRKVPTGREVQVLLLQKKQMQGMIENSMRKIEELLHNEMQFKKVIHELKLERDSRKYDEDEHLYTSEFVRKKQKECNEKLRQLQAERISLLSMLNMAKEKGQFLQSHLSKTETQLRNFLDEKRNFEQILRIEKDRYLNLELQFRRNKREYEILQKDKDAQINRLLKLKEVKSNTALLEDRNSMLHLQQQLKVIQKRYSLLLEQYQICLEQREKQKKQHEVKVVNQFMSRTANDPQSKALQETITCILERVHGLENKPREDMERLLRFKQEMEIEIKELKEQNQSLREKSGDNERLFNQNCTLKATLENRERKVAVLQQNENDLKEQIEKMKNKQRTMKKQKSMSDLKEFKSQYPSPKKQKKLESNISEVDLKQKAKLAGKQVQNLKTELAALKADKQQLQKQNRELRLRVLRLEFQVQKSIKEGQFSLNLLTKTHQSEKSSFVKQIETLKSKLAQKVSNECLQSKRLLSQKTVQIQGWKQSVELLQNKLSKLQQILRCRQNPELTKTKSQQQFKQLSDLRYTVQSLAIQNKQYVRERQEYQNVRQQNVRLRQFLRKSRSLNLQLQELWVRKQMEYESVNQLIQVLRD